MSLMWMPPQTTVPPGRIARSAAGTSAPTGAKMIAASSASGGGCIGAAGPLAAEPRANACAGASPGRVKANSRRPSIARHLGDDVRRRAEAVDAEPLGVARHAQAAVADQPGAQQRRRLGVAVAAGERKAVAGVGDRVLGVAAVDLVAGEAGVRAQVLLARPAVAASAAGPAEPGHADPLARAREPRRPRPRADDVADDLVAGNDRQLRLRQLAVDDVQVGAADGARGDLDQHLPGARPPAAAAPLSAKPRPGASSTIARISIPPLAHQSGASHRSGNAQVNPPVEPKFALFCVRKRGVVRLAARHVSMFYPGARRMSSNVLPRRFAMTTVRSSTGAAWLAA